jgi:hypothetical protein
MGNPVALHGRSSKRFVFRKLFDRRNSRTRVITKSRWLVSDNELFTDEQIESEHQRYGKFQVSLRMGENCAIDEVYCFLHEADARRFFAGEPIDAGEQGFKDRERLEDGLGKGFDRIQLWIDRKLVATSESDEIGEVKCHE